MTEPEITTPQDLLSELRWTADRIVMSPTYGVLVWLKKNDDGNGITDCCEAAEPCEYHARLTHQAPPQKQ